jgi:hypothetical protein
LASSHAQRGVFMCQSSADAPQSRPGHRRSPAAPAGSTGTATAPVPVQNRMPRGRE